jgi:hypothetical protein
MGDGWLHQIMLMGTVEGDAKLGCIAGERACPPEDCGGIPGYFHMMVILSDPGHEEHDEMLRWVGGKFAPNAFNSAAADQALKRLR